MEEAKELDMVEHLAIMANEFGKIVSLTNSLEELSKEETSIENTKKNIKDFSLKLEEITRVDTISEHKLVDYFKK